MKDSTAAQSRGGFAVLGPLALIVLFTTLSTIAREALPRPPLWVNAGRSLSAYEQDSGRVLQRLAFAEPVSAFAVESDGDRLWVLAGEALMVYSGRGALESSARIAVPQRTGRVALAVAAGGRDAWVAFDSGVSRVDSAGREIWSWPLRGPLVDISLDEKRSWLWVATTDELALLDQSGHLLQQVSLLSSGPARAVAYDPALDEAWVAAEDSVQRYTWQGERTLSRAVSEAKSLTRIVPDGSGGLWSGSERALVHLDTRGDVVFQSRRAGEPIIALGVDSRDGQSVWVATQHNVRHYVGGALFAYVGLSPVDAATARLQPALPSRGPIP